MDLPYLVDTVRLLYRGMSVKVQGVYLVCWVAGWVLILTVETLQMLDILRCATGVESLLGYSVEWVWDTVHL